MNPLETLLERWRLGRDLKLVALVVFLIQMALISPAFFPPLSDIGVWDEAVYINEGRDLVDGTVPSLALNPAVAGLYALTYLPVQASPYWLVHSCAIGRFLLFGLLWLSAFCVACQLTELVTPFIMMALVAISPALTRLLYNGSMALFAAMSGFALWQFLSFQRTRNLKHLWLSSLFLGLAALSRNEGQPLFLVFFGLSLALCVPAHIVKKGLTACLVPFAVLVGGYVLLYGLRTGDFKLGTAERSYLTFEMGHGMAFAEVYGTKQYYVEGQIEARRLFGTPEENHFSILTAIRHNPAAYARRILPMTKHAIIDGIASYGWYFGLLCFAFAARGVVDLIKRRSFALLATLLLWPAYCILYVLLCYQPSHLLMPFLSVFTLAAIGISAFSLNLASKRERYLWSGGLLALAIAAAGRGTLPNGPLTATLIILLGLWLIWLIADQFRGLPNMRAIGCLVLLSVGLICRFGLPQAEARSLGASADERAVLYLSTHFERGTRIAAWGPGKIWNAKMDYVTMGPDLRYFKSSQDVPEWMALKRVEAIYSDNDLRRYEPIVWDSLQKQIGNSLSVAFDGGDGAVQILVRTPRQ